MSDCVTELITDEKLLTEVSDGYFAGACGFTNVWTLYKIASQTFCARCKDWLSITVF